MMEDAGSMTQDKRYLQYTLNLASSIVHLVSCIFYLLSLSGCGYSVYQGSSFPFDSVRIGRIVNVTPEPKLQDKLHIALTEEFLRHGIDVTDSSENVLSGTITEFTLRILSERGEFATEYEAVITGNFTFTDREGRIKELKNISSPFIESFSGEKATGKIAQIVGAKENTAETALRGLSMMIVSELIYLERH